jgi:hypothetical protein
LLYLRGILDSLGELDDADVVDKGGGVPGGVLDDAPNPDVNASTICQQ